MAFNEERFQQSSADVTGKDPGSVLDIDVDDYRQMKTPVQKARFIKTLMDTLVENIEPQQAERIMRICGTNCIGKTTLEKAKKLHQKSKNTQDFLGKLNEHHIGGGHLRLDGQTIYAAYELCYCGSVSKAKGSIPLTYCHCSAGWYQQLFEKTLGRSVRVEVLQTIASGAGRCEFRIHI